MSKLIRKYLNAGKVGNSGGNTGNVGASFNTSLGGGNTWETSSYSNPYLYKGLSTTYANKVANLNVSNMVGSSTSGSKSSGGGLVPTFNMDEDAGFWEAGGGWDMIGLGASALGSIIPHKEQAALTEGLNSAYDMTANAIAAVPGFGTIASGAMKIGGLLADGLTALGVGTDGLTTMDLILDSKFMKLTPVGLMNAFGASKLATLRKDQAVSDTLASTDGGYSSFTNKWEEAQKYSGKKVGLFSGKKSLNNKIYSANERMAMLQGIIGKKKQDDLLTALMEDRWNLATMNNLNGGIGNISFGRLGLKVEILPKVHAILNKPKIVDTLTEFEDIQEFKDGGKMNVIPEGALHARLHHMDNAEGLTKKGIPVVSIAEGGEMELQAEIELNEIIFNLDVTTELEKLMKDGSDNAAIEAGKLLVKEIFENTDDRTGLIKLLEPEKKEPTTEDIVKNHQVFLKGGNLPTLKSIEELVDYAIKQNPAFVLRIGPDMSYAEFVDENGKTLRGTHLLSYAEDNGEYLVFPNIQSENGRLQYEKDWRKAFDKAKKAGNVIRFKDQSDAEKFTKEYKNSKLWKPYFDIWNLRYGSYKNGGVIEKINKLSPEQMDKLTNFLNSL